jgi:hypothetical protein
MWVRRLDQGADPFDQLGRNLVAPALVAEHLLQPPLELGVPAAGGAFPQVPLDLHTLEADELPVEVELDLAQRVLAINR